MTTLHTPGAPCWIDLMTTDTAETRAFYTGLFDWQAGEPAADLGGYFLFFNQGAPLAGVSPLAPDEEPPGEWSVYLATDDVTKALELAETAGSEVIVPETKIADMGTMAVVTDAGGAHVAMWQADAFAGIARRGEIGTQGWFELHTRAYDESVEFYRDVFGWDTHQMSNTPEFRYTTLGENEYALAGIMDASGYLPPGTDAHWAVYIQVADTDSSAARAVSLGGTIVEPAQNTPYGRLAVVADTLGCQIRLMGPVTS